MTKTEVMELVGWLNHESGSCRAEASLKAACGRNDSYYKGKAKLLEKAAAWLESGKTEYTCADPCIGGCSKLADEVCEEMRTMPRLVLPLEVEDD